MNVDVSSLADDVRRYGYDVASRALDIFASTKQAAAPRGETGKLAESVRVLTGAVPSGDVVYGTVGSESDIAGYLEEGTSPHRIPGNPLLAFQWHGRLTIVHWVDHPGSTKHVGWFSNDAESIWLDSLNQAA